MQSGREKECFKMAVIKRLNIEEVDNIEASVWVGFVQDSERLDEDDFEKETARNGVCEPRRI